MKKKLFIISSFILVIILIIIGILINKKNSNNLFNNYLNNGSNLAFYYETETGEYTTGESFASLDGYYSLNTSRSSCDNGLDTIEWDDTNKRIIMTSGKSNRCKLYFDINKRFTLLSYYPITGRDGQLTNVLGQDGDFEDATAWQGEVGIQGVVHSYVGCEQSSSFVKHGSSSCKVSGTSAFEETVVTSTKNYHIEKDHNYYVKFSVYNDSNDNVSMEYWWPPSAESKGVYYFFSNFVQNNWSSYSYLGKNEFADTQDTKMRIDNNNTKLNIDLYFDELMLIDLTQSYGENIPSKEELDNELIYFDGTVDIKSVTGRTGVFTVSDLPEVTQIECNNGGKAIVSGNTVTITGNSAQTTCYLKKTMIGSLLQSDPGNQGVLLKHTEELPNSAGDDGYRYSGNQPNNYICFGSGSEAYNNGETNECPLKNKYRVIGYVPVTLADGQTKTSLIKVIKAEYLTEEEFVKKDWVSNFDSNYSSLKRIETNQSELPGYRWNSKADNEWSTSSLYNSLNSDEYLSDAFGTTWQNKIENVTWNVGGSETFAITAKDMYEIEMNGQGKTTTFPDQIGLMYAHDYGFASSSGNWKQTLSNYNNIGNENRENNWMFNGTYEWTISPYTLVTDSTIYINASGRVGSSIVDSSMYGVRPVFYLKENVNIKDSDADGSREHPFRIAI